MVPQKAKAVLEAIVFAAAKPVPLKNLAAAVGWEEAKTELLLAELMREYRDPRRGIELCRVAGGYQFTTKAGMAPYLEAFHRPEVTSGLSQAALETLAIIAYRQPVTKVEIEDIRESGQIQRSTPCWRGSSLKRRGGRTHQGDPSC